MDADTVGFARATRACIEIAPSSSLLRTVWFPISGSLISHITLYCAAHLVGTIPNKEHLAVVIDNCV